MEISELKEVGSQYRVIDDVGNCYVHVGDVVTLVRRGGQCPIFTKGSIEFVLSLNRLEPIRDTPQKGDTVWVRDFDSEDWVERIYLGSLGDNLALPYCTIGRDQNLEDGDCLTVCWKQMKPFVELKEVEVTLQEIAELKGVSVDQIRIKD